MAGTHQSRLLSKKNQSWWGPSSLVPSVSRASGVSGFSQGARTRARALEHDPEILAAWSRIAWPPSGNSHSPKRKLIHHARIPPVISGERIEYYKSTSSSFHDGSIFMRDQSPPPSPLPPSISKRKRFFRRKKTQYFDTFRLYISFLSFPLLSSPCIGNNLWTTTTVLGKHLFHPYFHSVTDHAKSRERTSGHLSAGILRNFELFTGSYVIKGEAGSVGNRVVFVLFSIFLFSRSLYIGQIRQDF